MNVLFFLKERTKFIRQYYETAGEPFRQIMRKIDAGEAPFTPDEAEPLFLGEDEPPFLEEWIQAYTSLEVLGRTCISMLSASLKLYFQELEAELPIKWETGEKEKYFKDGFVSGYKRIFNALSNSVWDNCPVNFDILQQVALVRNDEQHPRSITTMNVRYNLKTRLKFDSLFFLSKDERKMFADPDIAMISWFQPHIHVSREKLLEAIEQVELLGDWLEDRYPWRYRY